MKCFEFHVIFSFAFPFFHFDFRFRLFREMSPKLSAVRKGKKRTSDRQIGQQLVADSSGSVYASSGQRKSARFLKTIKKKIYLCADVLYNIFPSVGNVRLGLGVALTSDYYDAVVDSYFNVKKRKLRRLWIRQSTDDKAFLKTKKSELVLSDSNKKLPFADVPPSNGIIGFKSISISCVDAKALDFLEHCRPLFNFGITFRCDGIGVGCGKAFRQLWPLLSANITKMSLEMKFFVSLRRLFGPSVLRECAKLRCVNTETIDIEGSPDDSANASPGKAILQWLYTPREDGHPKVLTINQTTALIEDIKKEFEKATTAVNFIVRLRRRAPLWFSDNDGPPSQFEMSNGQTGERLTLRHVVDDKRNDLGFDVDPTKIALAKFDIWLLERGPDKRREEKQWAQWANECPFDTYFWEENNVVYVNLGEQRQLGPRLVRMRCCCFGRIKNKAL